MLLIKESRCYEAKWRKAGCCWESNPGYLWLKPPCSALPLSHNSRTSTNPRNPLCTAQKVLNASVAYLAVTQYVLSKLRQERTHAEWQLKPHG